MPHTPGPWTYAYEGSGSHNVYDMANDDLVAQCGCDYGHDESFANGCLVAAAPEMYALLKAGEWSGNPCTGQPDYHCLACGRNKDAGHSYTCRLAAVLKAVEGNDNG
jgi:hypothetical protein